MEDTVVNKAYKNLSFLKLSLYLGKKGKKKKKIKTCVSRMIIGTMNKNRATKEDTNYRNWRREDSSFAILNRMTGGRWGETANK